MARTARNDGPPPAQPYHPLLWVAAAAAAGIVADRLLVSTRGAAPLLAWWAAGVATTASALLARRRGQFAAGAALCLAAAACIGGAWHHWQWNLAEDADLARFAGDLPEPACVEAMLVEPVRISPPPARNPLRAVPAQSRSDAVVRVLRIRDGTAWREAKGLCRLRVAGELRGPMTGDRLTVFARMGRPPKILNPGQFDWAAVERSAGRRSELYCRDPECVRVARAATFWSLESQLGQARQWCERSLSACVSGRAEPLALAVLLGSREQLTDADAEAFLETGTIHFLVVSGSNLAMLAAIVWQLGRLLGTSRRVQLQATLAAVAAYAAIVGPQPPVVRAAILAMAAILAIASGRRTSGANLLGAAALVVLALNPTELFRGGTQLSFLSVAALTPFARLAAPRRPANPLDRLLFESATASRRLARSLVAHSGALIAASIGVWLAAAPLVAYHFHMATPVGMLLTPVIWPLIGLALGASFLAITVGWLIPPLATLFGGACGWCLHMTALAVEAGQSVPGGHWYWASPPAWWLLGFYGVAGLWAAVPRWRPHWRWQASAALAWLALGFAARGAARGPSDELRCTFLAVGHGTCAVLELPGGQTVMYDAGSLGSPDQLTETISAFLWSRGIERIDQLILSHADVDHYNAVPGLVKRFNVGVTYLSPMMFDPVATGGRLTAPNYLRDVLAATNTPLREVWLGDRLPTLDGRVTLTVHHPPREGVMGRDNANSILLEVHFAGRRLLLPGDLESPGIELVMNDPPLDCDVLMAPHHGSDQSDPPGFAAWCRPEHVIMSGRRPTRTLASVLSYQQMGAEVLHTALDGAVTCIFSVHAAPQVSRFAQQ